MSYGRADIAIGVIDVGSPKGGKLGWAILAPDVPLSFHPAATRVLGLVTPRSVG